jgi:hypothetical protein
VGSYGRIPERLKRYVLIMILTVRDVEMKAVVNLTK